MDAQDINRLRMTKHRIGRLTPRCYLDFVRYFFKRHEGTKFIINQHHYLLIDVLVKVLTGEIKRLIINIPPGFTKTILAVHYLMAFGLALNPRSRFLHLSYSDELSLDNSSTTREIITSKEYQELWPIRPKDDTNAKRLWRTEQGGGIKSGGAGTGITGFRAGRMEEGFTGALIIDDPLKPDDAFSPTKRKGVNRRIPNTIKSRLALETTPIIIIMQRLHEEDVTGFLLAGGTEDIWHHLSIPAIIPEKKETYSPKYTHGVPIDYDLPPGALWGYKYSLSGLIGLKGTSSYTYCSQYDQRPAPLGGGIFKEEWWKFYTILPPLKYRFIVADTAQKTKEINDYSVFQCWGVTADNRLYLIDQIRGKWEAPELKTSFRAFINKHKAVSGLGNLRYAKVEDKASGTGLIQDIAKENILAIVPIQRNTDKITRVMDGTPYIQNGQVYLPETASYLSDYLSEHAGFTETMTHRWDDQVDCTLDAIAELYNASIVISLTPNEQENMTNEHDNTSRRSLFA